MDVTWTLDLSDRCSNSAAVILSLAKALTLIFRRKKKKSLLVYSKASVVHSWEMPSTAEVRELPTVRALQGTAEHPRPSTHCLLSSQQKLHSLYLSLHQCLSVTFLPSKDSQSIHLYNIRLASGSFLQIRSWHTTIYRPNPDLWPVFPHKGSLESSHTLLFMFCL